MATLNVVCSFLSRPLCSPPPRHKCNVGLNVIWRNVHERTFFFPMVVRQNSRLKMHSAQYFDNCVSEIKICKNTNVHLWPLQARMVGMHPKGQCAVRFTLGFKRHGRRSKTQLLPYSKPRRSNTCYQRRLFGFLFLTILTYRARDLQKRCGIPSIMETQTARIVMAYTNSSKRPLLI